MTKSSRKSAVTYSIVGERLKASYFHQDRAAVAWCPTNAAVVPKEAFAEDTEASSLGENASAGFEDCESGRESQRGSQYWDPSYML